MRKIIISLVLMMIVTIGSSCKKEEVFKFDAKLKDTTEVVIGESFNLEVKTKNVSGKDYEYLGSSTVIGAIVYLSKKDGLKEIKFRPQDVPVTKDLRHITIKNGDSIKKEWTFSDFTGVTPGSYDLHFEFENYKYTIKDFLEIKE